jgi:hypothetical protein
MTTPDKTLSVDAAELSVARQHTDAPFAPGTILAGRYRIVALLGAGGMGEVFRADDLKLGQPVALKFLPARMARNVRPLYDEVRLGRLVTHPNVCRIYDIIEWEDLQFLAALYAAAFAALRWTREVG